MSPFDIGSVKNLLARVNRLDEIEKARLGGSKGYLRSLMPGISPRSAEAQVRRHIQAAHNFAGTAGLSASFELIDDYTLGVTLANSRRNIREQLKLPIQHGMLLSATSAQKGLRWIKGITDLPGREEIWAQAADIRQPHFAARGYISATEGAASVGQLMASEVDRLFGFASVSDLSNDLKKIQRTASDIYKQAIYTAYTRQGFEMAGTPAAVLQAAQLRVMEPGKPLYGAQSAVGKGKFPINIHAAAGEQVFDPSKATKHLTAFRETARALGLNDLALKAETAREGYATAFKMGHISPFGMGDDPTRQIYQRWAILPLSVKPRDVTRVTTRAYEEAEKAVAGGKAGVLSRDAFRLPTKILVTGDPRLERAFGASAGGILIAEQVARQLSYKFGEEVRKPGVGSALISGLGGKYTLAASGLDITGGIGAIVSPATLGKSTDGTFVAKHGGALRAAIIEDVLRQIGGQQQVDKGGVLTPHKMKFLQGLAGIFSTKDEAAEMIFEAPTGYKAAKVPRLYVPPEAEFGATQMSALEALAKEYNRHAEPYGRSLSLGFEPATVDIFNLGKMIESEGKGGSIEGVSGYAIHSWLAARAGQELDVLNFAVGKGRRAAEGLTYTPHHGKGMKLQMRTLRNFSMYGTPEANAVVDLLTTAAYGYKTSERRDIFKTFLPLLGSHRAPDGINPDTLRATVGAFVDMPRGYEFTANQLTGTLLDPTNPFYKGFTVNLPTPIQLPGLGQAPTWINQMHMPGIESMGGFMAVPSKLDPSKSVYYANPAQKAVSSVYRDLMTGRGNLQESARRAYIEIAKGAYGNEGWLREMIEPKMGQSGYLRIKGMGSGEAAEALGTSIEAPFMVGISEADVRRMGVYKEFMDPSVSGRGYAYGLLHADPAQSYAHDRVVLYKMFAKAQENQLGPGMLGLHNSTALQMLRDNDADNLSALIVSGARAQTILKQQAAKHDIPELMAHASLVDSLFSSEQAMLGSMGATPSVNDPAVLKYREMLKYANDSVSAFMHEKELLLDNRAQQVYGTKTLTGAMDWFGGRMNAFMGKVSQAEGRAASAIQGALLQAGTIAKGAGVSQQALDMVDFMSKMSREYLEKGVWTTADTKAFLDPALALWEASKRTGEGILGSMGPEDVQVGAMALARGMRTMRLAALADKSFKPMGQLTKMVTSHQKPDDPLAAMLEAMSSLSETTDKTVLGEETIMARALGLGQAEQELVSGSVIAKRSVQAANKEIQKSGAEGVALPGPVLDRVIDWFKNPDVQNYKKAGALGGVGLLGFAVVKNLLLPGFIPADDQGQGVVHTAVPVPVRMPNLEEAQMPGMFDRGSDILPVTSNYGVPPALMNMGRRTQLQAVQMGAGTMQSGTLPHLAGGLMREPSPAPEVLNQDRYNDTPGSPLPPMARVAEPIETRRPTHKIRATMPLRGFDRGMFDRMPLDVTIAQEADESEYGILSSFADSNRSAFM